MGGKGKQQRSDMSGLSAMEKIEAIALAAKKAGMTYGEYSAVLSETQKCKVFSDYQKLLRKRRAEEQKRIEAFRRRKNGNLSDSVDWLMEELSKEDLTE